MDQHERPRPAGLDPQHAPGARSAGGIMLTTPQRDVVEATLSAIRGGVSLVVVTGDPDCGRSLVADVVAAALRDRGMRVDRGLPPGGRTPEALLAHAALLLRLDPGLLARAMLPPAPVMVTAGFVRAVTMVVDDADTWPAGALRMLLSLARVRLIDGPLLHVILAGQAGSLRPVLSAEALPAYASLRIVPLSPAQGREYLARHLAALACSGASLSAQAADDILAQAGGSPGRIDTLVRAFLAAPPGRRFPGIPLAGPRAARGRTLFRRSAAPAALLASTVALAVLAPAFLPDFGTRRPLPEPTRPLVPATGLPIAPEVAGLARGLGCLPALIGADEAAGRVSPGSSCVPTPAVLVQVHHPASPPPMPMPAVPVVPLSPLMHAPVAIGAEHVLSAPTLGLPSLADAVLPPVLSPAPLPADAALTAVGSPGPGAAFPPRRAPEAAAKTLDAPAAASAFGNHAVPVKALPRLFPDRPGAHASQAARAPGPEHARPISRDQAHGTTPEQPRPRSGGNRDNPDGLVSQPGVPYFCRAIRPGNQAENAYIQQVCGR